MFSVIAGPVNSGNMGIQLYYVELEVKFVLTRVGVNCVSSVFLQLIACFKIVFQSKR